MNPLYITSFEASLTKFSKIVPLMDAIVTIYRAVGSGAMIRFLSIKTSCRAIP
jgi:hypothetical protein